MKRFVFVALILFMLVFPVFAQEATPEPTPETTTEVTAETVDETPADSTTAEAQPESAQGASLAVILIGGAAIAGVIGFVMLRDGMLGKRK